MATKLGNTYDEVVYTDEHNESSLNLNQDGEKKTIKLYTSESTVTESNEIKTVDITDRVSCLLYIYEQIRISIPSEYKKDLILTPRKLHRTCYRTFSYHQGKMKCVKLVLVTLCFLFVFLSSMYVLGNGIHLRTVYINVTKDIKTHASLRTLLANHHKLSSVNKRYHKVNKKSLGTPFNANVWNNRTANTRKHYLILYWSKIRGHVARMQKKKEYEKDQHVWPYTYVGDECPVSCELTNDRTRAPDADAFVVHSRLTDVWDFPPFEYLAPWILQNNENPVYTPALMNPKIMSKFNLLISYRLDSDFPSPIYPMPSLSEPIPFDQRLGNVLAVFSKCEIVRTEYMRQLMKHIEVHSYGACLKNRDGLIGLYGRVNGKYVFKDYKLVLTRFYKFSLVFMNQDCDYFVDDRLYHALETGSIPVYLGTNKIEEFLPGNLKNSIIRVSDFKSPLELANYLKYLSNNETAFNEYLAWKTKGIGDLSNTTIGRWWKPKYPLFCQVCMRLAQGGLHPGLNTDICKPRSYSDWNLLPPYGADDISGQLESDKNNEIDDDVEDEDDDKLSFISTRTVYFYAISLFVSTVFIVVGVIKMAIKFFVMI